KLHQPSKTDLALLDAEDYKLGAKAHDDAVAQGVTAARAGNYRQAVELIGKADETPAPKSARFRLLPLLAYLHYKAGDQAAAAEMVRQAKLVTLVMTGRAKCPKDVTQSIRLVSLPTVEIDPGNLVTARVCGALPEKDLMGYGQGRDLMQRYGDKVA